MSLAMPGLASIVKKQYAFKLKAYMGVFTPLIVLQLTGILFSMNGVGSTGGGLFNSSFQVNYYSADLVIAFTILWGFINAILITTKDYKEDDFSFVTNRLSNNLANVLFLFTASFIGGITAILTGYLLRVLMYFVFDFEPAIDVGLDVDPPGFVLGIFAAILFVFLGSSFGYLVGSLVQLHKIFIAILPVVIIGSLLFLGRDQIYPLLWIGEFYFQESSFLLFLGKIFVTAGLVFAASSLLSNRQEVRK